MPVEMEPNIPLIKIKRKKKRGKENNKHINMGVVCPTNSCVCGLFTWLCLRLKHFCKDTYALLCRVGVDFHYFSFLHYICCHVTAHNTNAYTHTQHIDIHCWWLNRNVDFGSSNMVNVCIHVMRDLAYGMSNERSTAFGGRQNNRQHFTRFD